MSFIIGLGSETDPNALRLHTKAQNHITNVKGLELPPDQLMRSDVYNKGRCPGIRLRALSATYNCMGMVFAARRTTIDCDALSMIVKDDKYKKFTDVTLLKTGDIVVYGRQGPAGDSMIPTHVGVVIKDETSLTAKTEDYMILSKWGEFGEYIHQPKQVPEELGVPIFYLTDRRLNGIH